MTDPNKKVPVVLDYSSTAQEQCREGQEEDDRRQALKIYKESTFGERHPIAICFVSILIFTSLLTPLFWLFPRRVAVLFESAALVTYWFSKRGRT